MWRDGVAGGSKTDRRIPSTSTSPGAGSGEQDGGRRYARNRALKGRVTSSDSATAHSRGHKHQSTPARILVAFANVVEGSKQFEVCHARSSSHQRVHLVFGFHYRNCCECRSYSADFRRTSKLCSGRKSLLAVWHYVF